MATPAQHNKFVLCIDNENADDLEKGKVYQVIDDESAARSGYIRVIDESREDYLYPETCFVPIDLPNDAKKSLLA